MRGNTRGPGQLCFRVEEGEDGVRLSSFLRRRGLSVTLIRRVKYEEEGILAGHPPAPLLRSRTDRILHTGEEVQINLPVEDCPVPPQEGTDGPAFEIIYESPHALVLEKPAGLVMHPTRSHKDGTLANAFAALMARRGESRAFRPVGRLDGDTSGLVLCAMNPYAAPLLACSMKKSYLALVGGCMSGGEGEIDAPLAAAPGSAILQRVDPAGRPSRTGYEVLAANEGASLLRVWPRTGRTHQIRAHMAHVGHPLLGDGLYGGDKTHMGRHALHCARLIFTQPGGLGPGTEGGGDISLVSPLPKDIRAALVATGLCQAFESANL